MSDQGESNQREIHIDTERLREFFLGDDRETRISALRAIDGILDVRGGNAPKVQAEIIEFLKSDIGQAKEVLLNSSPEEQLLFVSALGKMARLSGKDCPNLSIAAIEAALETKNIELRKDAQNLLRNYLELGVNREGIMRALVGEAALSLSWENAEFFGFLATHALRHNDSRERGLFLLANIASHTQAKKTDRESAINTLEIVLLKGMDVSCIEKEMRAFAKKRDGPLCENAKELLAAAEMRSFNKAGEMGRFRKIELRLTPIFASPPLRRTGTSA